MFSKLFKYEFKSTAKFGWPLLIGGLLLGVLIDTAIVELYFSINASFSAEVFLTISGGLFLALGIFAIAALSAVTMIMILKRFYDSTMKAEGYLTFTLPVKTSDLILTKVLNAWLWDVMVGIVIVIDVIGAFTTFAIVDPISFAQILEEFLLDLGELGELLAVILASSPSAVFLLIGGILLAIIAGPSSIMVFFTIITFVSLNVKKHRVLIIVLLYYALSLVTGTVSSIFQTLILFVSDPMIPLQLSVWLSVIGTSALLVGGFFLTKYLFEKKLNLE